MFREFLQLSLSTPHNKQAYSLRKNELLIRDSPDSVKFDSICYTSEDIMSKITYETLLALSKTKQKQSMTVTFNYNLQAKDLVLLVSKFIDIKIFQRIQLGHFQVKNGHISDYHANKSGCALIDDLDQFDKELNKSVNLDRLWKINQFLQYRSLSSSNIHSEMGHINKKFSKRTNEFFVLQINGTLRIILIILPRNRDQVFTREEEKQIEELYIITKHAKNLRERHIAFNTSIAQIIKNYVESAEVNFFVSCYPQQEKQLREVLQLPMRLNHPHEEEIEKILQGYKKDKLTQLMQRLDKCKKTLREAQSQAKFQEQNISKMTKIYTKTFHNVLPSIEHLKQKGITNVLEHISWLKSQIKLEQEQIANEQEELKKIHQEMIKQQKRHLFYLNKIRQHKNSIISRQSSPQQTPLTSYQSSLHENKENAEITEDLLMFFYNPQKEISRYREKKDEEMRVKLNASKEKLQFMKLLEEAKKKIGREEFNAFEQKYYHLINS